MQRAQGHCSNKCWFSNKWRVSIKRRSSEARVLTNARGGSVEVLRQTCIIHKTLYNCKQILITKINQWPITNANPLPW